MTEDDVFPLTEKPEENPREAAVSSAAEIARHAAPELDRLPPPAFPPGQRKAAFSRRGRGGGSGSVPGDPSFPDEAFLSPDDPGRRIGSGALDDAFISPDDPIRKRSPRNEVDESAGGESDEGGVVTGIGSESPLYFESGKVASWDPELEIATVANTLERLAVELREKGGTALLIHPESPPLESAIRGLLAGFLLRYR